ncbi:hypothetical protein EC988_004931, partial [Linderina pennispora]
MTSSVDSAIYFSYTPVNILPEVVVALFIIIAAVVAYKIIKTCSAKWDYILIGTAIAEAI